ncbi:MAG: hypothetical protein ACO2ON_03985 [Candidatus Nanopusillus sp.]
MDTEEILTKTYNLFVEAGVLIEGSLISDEIKEHIAKGEYEKAARLFIYMLVFEMNNNPVYSKIIHKKINDFIVVLYKMEEYGINNKETIDKFIDTIIRFYLYSLEHKLDLRLNNEKRESIKAKLRELVNII